MPSQPPEVVVNTVEEKSEVDQGLMMMMMMMMGWVSFPRMMERTWEIA